MRSLLVFVAVSLLLTLGLRPLVAAEPEESVKLSKAEKLILDRVNAAREGEKLDPLSPHPILMTLARDHSANMARQRKLDHTLDGKTPSDRMKATDYPVGHSGENIGWGPRLTPEGAFLVWKGSPPHWANILGKYREIGIGQATAGNGDAYYTLVFGDGGGTVRRPGPMPEPAWLVDGRKKMLEGVNSFRMSEKAATLKLQPQLTAAAQSHAANMARQGMLEHKLDGKTGPERVMASGYSGEYGGQLIASFDSSAVKEVIDTWKSKEAQRARLLSEVTDVGVGLAKDARGEYWYCLVFGSAVTVDPKADARLFDEATATILALTNAARKAEKLSQLTLSDRLSKIGRGHSTNMAKQQKMEHVLDGKAPQDRVLASGYDYSDVGENLGSTTGDTFENIFKLWMDSKDHRKQILNPDFREMGMGLVRDEKGKIWFTQLFGTVRQKKP